VRWLGRPESWIVAAALLVAAGTCLFAANARAAYEDELASWRSGDRLAEWLAAEGAALGHRFAADHAQLLEDAPAFVLETSRGEVSGRFAGLDGRWRFTTRFPGGLAPGALAAPATRLAAETGRPPASLDAVDPHARRFAALLRKPDLAALRTAPLPAQTKLFLARRWGANTSGLKLLAGALGEDLAGLAPGVHPRGAVVVAVLEPSTPRLVLADPGAVRAYREAVGDVYVRYGPAPPDALWAGRLEEPLAGTWSVAPAHGAWWRSRRFPVYWFSAMVGVLWMLAALLVVVRRRRKLDEARARFVTELAHDLRTPLTALRMHAELFASGRAPEGEQVRYAGVMARESARLSGLLANLLDLSRLERGGRSFDLARVRVGAVVAEAVHDFAVLYPARARDVEVSGPDHVEAHADRTALARCLANLLDNAGKFTEAGTPIRVHWNDRVEISVADEGPGIPRRDRARLFRRYERGRTNGAPGTGMGLALVRELAAGMGGDARAADAETGARLVLYLRKA